MPHIMSSSDRPKLPFPYPSPHKSANLLTQEEKLIKIGRNMPCDEQSPNCNCRGWKPKPAGAAGRADACLCGHKMSSHGGGHENMERRLKIAVKIDELLEEKGKLLDFEYEDENIKSLRRQILFKASPSPPTLRERSRSLSLSPPPSSPDEENSDSMGKHSSDSSTSPISDSSRHKKRAKIMVKNPAPPSSNDDQEVRIKSETVEVTREDFPAPEEFKASPPKRVSPAVKEEEEGLIEFRIVNNDGKDESMILLTGLKNIFQKQLPMMPKEYITRLVFDRHHYSMALIRKPLTVIGGICYHPFEKQEFAEIVFCAIASTEQVKGYGSHLMNHLKDYISINTNMRHFLTYADNYATGYFRKQGFTTEITFDQRKWMGYIKDYEGGTIMQCDLVPRVQYLKIYETLSSQRQAVYKKMQQYSASHIVYDGIARESDESLNPLEVPGIRNSGWTPEMDNVFKQPQRVAHYNQMHHIVAELQAHNASWPFLMPVNEVEVQDYYEYIKDPMDLSTLEQNVEKEAYPTMKDFVKDVQKIFDNCRTYNAEGTPYAKCANRLEKYFRERLRVWGSSTSGDDNPDDDDE